jgi:hypothetical protein
LSPLDEYRILATVAGESDKLNPLSCAKTAAMIQELVEGTETQEKFKGSNVSRQFTQTFRKRYDGKRGGPMKTTYPQTMTPLRAQWTTFANIEEYFYISLKCLVETPNRVAVLNPDWETATEEERATGAIDRALARLPGCMGTIDEMPLTLNVSTGHKSKSDKKFTGSLSGVAHYLKEKGVTADWAKSLMKQEEYLGKVKAEPSKLSGLRGNDRARQVSTKFNKVGTLVMGCKADGDRYIPLVIVRSANLAKEHSYSMVEGPDGKPMEITLPRQRVVAKNRGGFVVATPNGGMNKDFFDV